jgi:hypothetical protein
VRIGSNGRWQLSGTGSVTSDGFITSVTISSPETNVVEALVRTTWNLSRERTGTVEFSTRVTNWRRTHTIGNWSVVTQVARVTESPAPAFNGIAVAGNTVFVTSDLAAGAGLYLYDITTITSPTRIVDTFTMAAPAYDVLVGTQNRLFVVTGTTSDEVRIYDISSPSTFSEAALLGSYNLPGSGRGRSLALIGGILFVGATQDGTEHELYVLDVSDPSAITLLDSLSDEGSYNDIMLYNGYAYIASSEDVSELVVIDTFDPANLTVAPGSGYNLTDTPDGLAARAFSNRVLVGRSVGAIIQELALFDITNSPAPSPPPGPWYHDVGASSLALSVDPTGRYAFLATDQNTLELQVYDVPMFANNQYPRVGAYSSTTGIGRAVHYDLSRDRLFFATSTALHILRPN